MFKNLLLLNSSIKQIEHSIRTKGCTIAFAFLLVSLFSHLYAQEAQRPAFRAFMAAQAGIASGCGEEYDLLIRYWGPAASFEGGLGIQTHNNGMFQLSVGIEDAMLHKPIPLGPHINSTINQTFRDINIRLGYEHRFGQHWSVRAGISAGKTRFLKYSVTDLTLLPTPDDEPPTIFSGLIRNLRSELGSDDILYQCDLGVLYHLNHNWALQLSLNYKFGRINPQNERFRASLHYATYVWGMLYTLPQYAIKMGVRLTL